MKKKHYVFVVGLFLVLSCVTTVVIHLGHKTSSSVSKSTLMHTTEDSKQHRTLAEMVTIEPASNPETVDNPWEQHNAIASRFDTRVRFWGRVVDQDEIPLEGVKVTASVTTLRMIKTENGFREYEVLNATSDAAGAFMFDGSEGMYLDIDALGKEGYVLPSAYQFGMSCAIGAKFRYRYSSIGNLEKVFTPNKSHPEIFHLWKLKRPEPLDIGGNIDGHNGPEFKVGAPPDQLRTISIMVSDVGSSQVPQWEVTVSALEADGGVIKADPSDIFMFQAPESGYTHSIKFRYGLEGADESQDDPGAALRFYVRSNGGRWYAAREYDFFSPNKAGVVETKMRFWLNPNGSRNLEHDGGHPLRASSLTQ